ncbi:MAG: hypothetical protein IJ168_05735 [Eubacterium sp.]|nr:hypothetical protein [Eubacterium sp.]
MAKNTFRLPLWGPYSKKYMGISHIIPSLADIGARFDFIVHPNVWNSATPVPNVTVPSAYHLWECAPDYSYYSYRYELLWKDQLYADVSFSKVRDGAYVVRTKLCNRTDLFQCFNINLFSALEYPETEYTDVITPEKCVILGANDYQDFRYAVARPWDHETPDGLFRGMFRDKEFYGGCGLGDRCDHQHVHYLRLKPFGAEKGDSVTYRLAATDFERPVLLLRYRTVGDGDAHFTCNGRAVTLPHSNALCLMELPYTENPCFESSGGAGVEFDFLAVVEKGETVRTVTKRRPIVPAVTSEATAHGQRVQLDYGEGIRYTVFTEGDTRLRTLESGSLEDALINRLSNGDHTYDDLTETFSRSFQRKHSDDGFYQNTMIKSIYVPPQNDRCCYVLLTEGDGEALTPEECEQIYQARRAAAGGVHYNREGEKYALSTGILRATLLTNAVYPVYRHGENVIHHTPGKRWDSFYTWDSGFIGMGLLEYSPALCRYALEQYLCDDSNQDFAFLLHGSLVPTQFYEYFELLGRTEDKHSLDALYPMAKRYYEFLRGRSDGSTFAKFGNGLLTAYDYWYSCSGMDDYPAQVAMIKNKAEQYSCPCLTTAQVIRVGKIMKMIAVFLGKAEDVAVYENDIAVSEQALNDLAWDEESGYFGYTMYDKETPYLMKTADGENWNKGMDGIYPLISGSVTGERRQRLLAHLKNPNELWSPAGVSAVDMTASYFLHDGYWNGNVWMSHQWFVWKTMLDLGDTDFAYAIAERALDMWKEETDFSYCTYECFNVVTRRGGWFHHFGGLSAPICIWANAYYRPQTVTTGFDVWTDYRHLTDNSAELQFTYYGNSDRYALLITLSDQYQYSVTLDGKALPFTERKKGCLEIILDGTVKGGVIQCHAE